MRDFDAIKKRWCVLHIPPISSLSYAENDIRWLVTEVEVLRARITELEEPGELNSIHKLRGEVNRLSEAIEEERKATARVLRMMGISLLAEACERGEFKNLLERVEKQS